MPKAATKTTAVKGENKQAKKQASPTPAPAAQPAVRPTEAPPVVYDKLEIKEYSTTSRSGPLTPENLKVMLGWETEDDYKTRMIEENPASKPDHWSFGEVFHCLDGEKRKVRCWNNGGNRPFDMGWCEEIREMILQGQWAGPLTVPGETVNGETIRVGRYGRVLSGQHQGTACILADELLQKSRAAEGNARDPKYPFWNGREHCVIETIVILGLSEDERVLRTIDYVKPRSAADMLYTMPLFKERTPAERKEMTRMLSAAIDTLWDRTDARGYRTHPEIVGFLERHKRLLRCVEHLFIENRGSGKDVRRIGRLRLNPGQCAGYMYLMACGTEKTTDYSDEYRNEMPPSERGLDFGYLDRAEGFWSGLADVKDTEFRPVRMALGRLLDSSMASDDNPGLGGRGPEKQAILARAWEQWRDHPDDATVPCFDEGDLADDGCLCLHYSDLDDQGRKLPEGQLKLLDIADFRGIDCPDGLGKPGAPPMPPPMTAEELERAKAEAIARRGADKKIERKK